MTTLSRLETRHIRIYTDGGRHTDSNSAGFGIRIVSLLHNDGKETILLNATEGLANVSVSEAELTTVQEALYRLEQEFKLQIPHVCIFTDSKYTLHASTSPFFRKKHYYIVQEIQNIAHRIKRKSDLIKIVMHYVPSHIENTSTGLRRKSSHHKFVQRPMIVLT